MPLVHVIMDIMMMDNLLNVKNALINVVHVQNRVAQVVLILLIELMTLNVHAKIPFMMMGNLLNVNNANTLVLIVLV